MLVPATAPTAPFAPNPWRSAILGFGVGLFAGIGLAFLLEQFDTRLRTTDEIAYALRVPILGRIPRIPKREITENTLVTLTHPDGHAAEAFRMVRTNLDFMNVDADVESLVITSCVQGEGKSVAVANLAVTMALAGKKVVVVDGDLRRPRQHKYFGLRNEVGLSTVVTGQTNLAQSLQAVEVAGAEPGRGRRRLHRLVARRRRAARLYVLTSGPLPPNPGEIVAAKRFAATIERLQREADLVIVDSPAMLPVGDASAIASSVDGLVFLVDMHLVKRPQLGAGRRPAAPPALPPRSAPWCARDGARQRPLRLLRLGLLLRRLRRRRRQDQGPATAARNAAACVPQGARRPPTRPRAAPPARRRCTSGRRAARPPLLESRR